MLSALLYLIVLLILGYLVLSYVKKHTIMEPFETYSYGPYNYMDTGASPLSFYKYPIYRKPFMYPYQFYSSYPYPHMTYYPTNI